MRERKFDDRRADHPSSEKVKVRIMLYDVRHCCKACITKYLELTGSKEEVFKKAAPNPYLTEE